MNSTGRSSLSKASLRCGNDRVSRFNSAPKNRLRVLPECRDADGIPSIALWKWNDERDRREWVRIPITDEELDTQSLEPIRLAHEPRFWLFRDRFVEQENASSEPDVLVDLLDSGAVIADPGDSDWDSPTNSAKYRGKRWDDKWMSVKVNLLRRILHEAGEPVCWNEEQLKHMIQEAIVHRLPVRHSALARSMSAELVLRVKHAVLTEERALEKLRREVEAFEQFEDLRRTPRERIPDDVGLFVWQRDGGRCARCGSRERIE